MGTSGMHQPRPHWRILTGVAAAALCVPFLTATPAVAAPGGQHLLSVLGDDVSTVAHEVELSGGRVLQTFDVADALLVSLPAGVSAPKGAVEIPDSPMVFNGTPAAAADAPVNTYRDTIDVPAGVTGAGVTVALIDTGVANTGEVNVTHVNVSGGPQGDGLGHGTFLAGLIAGSGAASDGAYQGVAPGAKVLDVQVALPDGATSMSKVLAGLQAVADARSADPSVKVVNLSLSSGSPLPPWIDPLSRGLEQLWDNGVTVVVSSGNDTGEVSSPASDPTLFAVGAVDENQTAARGDDSVAEFSGYGKTFGAERPDVVAPGVSLVSLKADGSQAALEYGDTASVGAKYFKGTGTSMSAAVASGATASLLSRRPDLSPNSVKRLFKGTAYSGSLGAGAGQGGLNLSGALDAKLADMPAVDSGPATTDFSPAEADAATWKAFSDAWAAGDFKAVVKAWVALSPQTRKWAATNWSLAVLGRALTMSDNDFDARRWAARRWAVENWNARRWASDEWVARRWAAIDWSDADWAPGKWDNLEWAARRWANQDWLAFAWTTRNISADPTVGDQWVVDGTEWDTEEGTWAARRWATTDWAGRRWADEAWSARRWADFVYDARRWSTQDWAARRWSDAGFNARRWSDAGWSARRWSQQEWNARRWSSGNWSQDEWDARRWSARRWSTGEWDARRWSDFTTDARRWSSEDWSARRWS